MSEAKKGGRPKGPTDEEVEALCQTVRNEADDRDDFRAKSFVNAANQFALITRGANKAARMERIKAGEPAGSYEGDITHNDAAMLEAILAFEGRSISTRIIATYNRFAQATVLKGIARLRAAEIIEQASFAVRWERFGAHHYDAEIGQHHWDLISLTEDVGGRWSCVVFQVIAAFGRPDLGIEDIALLSHCGVDEVEAEIPSLRRAKLIKPDSLEIDRDDILRRLAII